MSHKTKTEPTAADIESLAREVLLEENGHEVAAAVRVGNLILEVLFAGDFEAYLSQIPTKNESLSRLAKATGRSRTTLSNRIKVANQFSHYESPFRDQVSFSHHVALLAADPLERNALLRRAAIEEMTVRELEVVIDPAKKPTGVVRPTGLGRFLAGRKKLLASARLAAADEKLREVALREVEETRVLLSQMHKVLRNPPSDKPTKQ